MQQTPLIFAVLPSCRPAVWRDVHRRKTLLGRTELRHDGGMKETFSGAPPHAASSEPPSGPPSAAPPEATSEPLPAAVYSLRAACSEPVADVLALLGSTSLGLSSEVVREHRVRYGSNVLRSHKPQPIRVLVRQFNSPLLLLLIVAAAVSGMIGQVTEAVLIGVIIASSGALGFMNEYRAERAAAALHDRIQQNVAVRRDGQWTSTPLVDLVPGDVVRIGLGSIVPADLRLLTANALECDESVLTGESVPVAKTSEPVRESTLGSTDGSTDSATGSTRSLTEPVDPFSCGLHMGTVIRRGDAEGVVVATGGATEFGRVALALGDRHPATEFEKGLRRYSMLLAKVAVALAVFVFATSIVRGRPVIDAALFSLAVAVGITPELLPVVVTTCMATGARRLAQKSVLVKRLVCIEDLGDISVLLTDKTGTLTEGVVAFSHAISIGSMGTDTIVGLAALTETNSTETNSSRRNENSPDVRRTNSGRSAVESIDDAIAMAARDSRLVGWTRIAELPFDHDRRVSSVLVDDPTSTRWIMTKGAPEAVFAMCGTVEASSLAIADKEFRAGLRLLAVARRAASGMTTLRPADEHDLELVGFVAFADPPKPSAAASVARLVALGVEVKIATGDNALVAERVCSQLGMTVKGIASGNEVDASDDQGLVDLAKNTTIFARVSPEQKARILRALRTQGKGVAFMGDGVNDAVALHAADVGISVDTAADVARDAADVVLLQKDLGVLAEGVVEGRRIFANTMKYVLIGTSSAFGNMLSAAAASVFLSFLPMLPAQILLNNLLYESSQMAIPTDTVDDEQLRRPAQWDLALIRRFMATFGPLSSIFDIVTFVVMLKVFHASEALFRTGWFTESLVTQTAVMFVIRTRRFPFYRSTPSRPVIAAALLCIFAALAIPVSPFKSVFGFVVPPPRYFVVLGVMAITYLVLVDVLKNRIRHDVVAGPEVAMPRHARVNRRASRWTQFESVHSGTKNMKARRAFARMHTTKTRHR